MGQSELIGLIGGAESLRLDRLRLVISAQYAELHGSE
jgi:hypothetical protein